MLGRLLQVRRGESARAVLLFGYLFLVIASYVVTKSARDALFLEHYSSSQLPYADIASALSVAVVMAVYLRVLGRVGLRPLLIGTLLAFSAISLTFWTLTRSGEPGWMLPVLYIWASVSGVLLPAQVWTLANYVMTTREAKRLVGVVGSGALCGWIVGGMITKATAMRLGTPNLLLMTSLTLAILPAVVVAIWRERRAETADLAAGPGETGGLAGSFDLVWHSPHLRSIATLILLSSLVTTLVAWQFRALAKMYYPDTDALTAFFGNFNIYAGTLSLAAQLLVTSRLLRRFGLGVALVVVPFALIVGSLGVLAAAAVWSAVLLKGCDQVLRYSIDRSTVELLYLPVPARELPSAKALTDTVIWRLGDATGSLVVSACLAVGLAASQVSLVSLVLLVAWIAAAVSAKRHYVENLRNSIHGHRVDGERLSVQVAERSTIDALAGALGADDPADILYALTLLESQSGPIPLEAVQRLLDHRSSEVRSKAISLLDVAGDTSVMARVERLLADDGDAQVRTEAFLYLARLSDVDPLARLGELDRVHASAVSSAITQFLARPGPKQNIEAARLLIDIALDGKGPDGVQARLEVARVISSLPDGFDDQLCRLLQDIAPEVARLAIRAVASQGKEASVPLVVARLGDPDLFGEALDALAAFGDRALPALCEALDHERTPASVRQAIPEVLQRVASPSAEQALVGHLLDADPVLRLRTVAALNKLRQLHPERRLERELVETVLAAEILGHYRSYQLLGKLSVETVVSERLLEQVKESMAHELERIFRLMKLLHPQHDFHSAFVGLQSGSAVVHANALEFLEHSLPSQLRALLLPLIDSEVGLSDRIKLAERMVGATDETSGQALAAFAASDRLLREAADKARSQLAVENAARPGIKMDHRH